MEISVTTQSMTFLYACLVGAAFGVLYDVFRILRLAFPKGSVLIIVEDILFFAICGVCTFFFLLTFSSGQVRYYIILGILVGFFLYYFTLGKLIYAVSGLIIKGIKKALHFLFRVISWPFRKIFGLFWKLTGPIRKKCKTFLQKRPKKPTLPLQRKHSLLYNLFKHPFKTKSKNSKKVVKQNEEKRKA